MKYIPDVVQRDELSIEALAADSGRIFTIAQFAGSFGARQGAWEVASSTGSAAMEVQPIRILLVDDDLPFLHSLEILLKEEPGLELVGMAASGEEALEAATRAEPDVAVIDVLMPSMSGIECARRLRDRHPKVRVILISGSIFEDRRPRRDEQGTDAYLEKREVPERLSATILALAAETAAVPRNRSNS